MTLELVLPEPWLQRADESDEDYREFMHWLEDPKRAIPGRPDLAQRFEWTKRGVAYDQAKAQQSPAQALKRTTANLMRLADLECQKWVRAALQDTHPVLSVRDVVALMAYLRETDSLSEFLREASAEYDLSDLSAEQLRALQKASKIVQKIKGVA